MTESLRTRLQELAERWRLEAAGFDHDPAMAVTDCARELDAALAAVEAREGQEPPLCVIGKFCRRHGFIHGAEAEELRQRVETLLAQVDHEGDDAAEALDRGLRVMLDDVDARDSLAWRDSRAAAEGRDVWMREAVRP